MGSGIKLAAGLAGLTLNVCLAFPVQRRHQRPSIYNMFSLFTHTFSFFFTLVWISRTDPLSLTSIKTCYGCAWLNCKGKCEGFTSTIKLSGIREAQRIIKTIEKVTVHDIYLEIVQTLVVTHYCSCMEINCKLFTFSRPYSLLTILLYALTCRLVNLFLLKQKVTGYGV